MKFKIYYLLFFELLFFVFHCKHSISQEYAMPSFVHAIDACDMDMDGSNDLIVSCAYIDSLIILFNDGYGNFELYYYSRITGDALCGCIDGDGIPDIITGKEEYLYFIKNNADKTLGENIILTELSGPYTLYGLRDMNNDGWNDLIYDYPTYWGIFKNNGNLTFTNKIIGSDGGPAKPSIGFFNDDSLPDIVVSYDANSRSQVTKYLINNGNFNFSFNTLNNVQYLDPIVSELNNLYPDDLSLFYTPTNEVHLFENTGNSNFILKNIHYINNSAGVYFANRADYNNDGFDDFSYIQGFWTGLTDSLYVELNDHNWSFERAQQYYIGTLNWFRIKSADLNGDHYPDFYMTGYDSNYKVKILWNNGDGTFSYLNPVGIRDSKSERNSVFDINPNPFLSNTNIKINCIEVTIVSLKIIDMQGIEIKSLINNQKKTKGIYQIKWNGTDNAGKDCKPGVYIVVLKMNEIQYSYKIIHY